MLTALCTAVNKLGRVFFYFAIAIISLSQVIAYFTPSDAVRIITGLISGVVAALTFSITVYLGLERASLWLLIFTVFLINVILPVIEIIMRYK